MAHLMLIGTSQAACGLQAIRDLLQVTDYGDLRYLLAETYNQNVRSLLNQAEPWAWQTEGVNVPPGKVGLCSILQPCIPIPCPTCASVVMIVWSILHFADG